MKKRKGRRTLAAVCLTAAGLLLGACGRGRETAGAPEGEGAQLTALAVDYRTDPMGIEEQDPVFSWQMSGEVRGLSQSAYRILVADSEQALEDGAYVWDSGRVESDRSVSVPYGGEPLQAVTRYYWTVEAWDREENRLEAERTAWFETGLMGTGFDGAAWISAPEKEPEPFAEEDCSYTIEYDFTGGDVQAGFLFGADTDRYGEFYAWIVEVQDGTVCLRTARMERYSFREEEVTPLDVLCTPEEFASGRIHMRIEVEQERVRTYLNGQPAAETVLAKAKPVGRIGLFNDRTEDCAWFDNITVTGADGGILYAEDFEDAETVFSPEYLKVRDGMGGASGGITLVPGDDGPAPFFRKEFDLGDRKIASARLYASALGIYHIYINGEAVSSHAFDPGRPVYDRELPYCIYDVTELLKSGGNAVGVLLGHGWYDRALGRVDSWASWGKCGPAFLGKLAITYEDGTQQTVVTDGSWQVFTDGPVRRDDMYQGEFYDARCGTEDWSMPGAASAGWQAAAVNAVDEVFLETPFYAYASEAAETVMTLEPVNVTQPEEGVWVYDFGQEFNGVCEITVSGQAGQCAVMRYAEALNTEELVNRDDEVGTVWTQNLLSARNTDYYVLKGAEEEVYAPSLVCRGFRYVQISGLEEGQILSVRGLVQQSALPESGRFESSDIWLNRLYYNIFWSQRSNFLETPTDCPQRDERFGWTGDIAVFSSTAVYNMDADSFLRRFLRGMRQEQQDDGAYPDMVPHSGGGFGHNVWGDAGVILTWELYQQYADLAAVEDNYAAMCAWVDYLEKNSDDHLRDAQGYGDHLSGQSTPGEAVHTAYSAYSALLLSKMANALGKEADAAHYREVYEAFRRAWQDAYVLEDGMLTDISQTMYAMVLSFGLYPEEGREEAGEMLAACVEWPEWHPAAGYAGLPWLLPALEEEGHTDLAYRLLMQDTYPSWNYETAVGATTVAESWDGYRDEGDGKYSLNGSLNHYALGSVGEWFYTGILGIRPAEEEPGFKRIILKPQIRNCLEYASGSYESVYGEISVRWEIQGEGYRCTVRIPANTSAVLTLPLAAEGTCTEGGAAPEEAEGITVRERTDEELTLELLSGSYDFTVDKME